MLLRIGVKHNRRNEFLLSTAISQESVNVSMFCIGVSDIAQFFYGVEDGSDRSASVGK